MTKWQNGLLLINRIQYDQYCFRIVSIILARISKGQNCGLDEEINLKCSITVLPRKESTQTSSLCNRLLFYFELRTATYSGSVAEQNADLVESMPVFVLPLKHQWKIEAST